MACSEIERSNEYELIVVFRLEDATYGIAIEDVSTVIKLPEITEITNAPYFVLGVCNLRGTIIPIVDLRKRLGLTVTIPTTTTRVIVIESDRSMVGLVVDTIVGTRLVAKSQIECLLPLNSSSISCLSGIVKTDEGLIMLINQNMIKVGSI